ncbi:oxidoreductase [Ktedonobacter sp. SOSP1-85]|uniref:quinone oxidoreductase family protein n=1 Tax=Ktedonobacter sp. SOSP1-85 TaxID=2778367 RepID=UPI0019164C44|nr:zinc-binding alcohol dehydrogenase family protein [Ktedonobacter sp. SOSP1-85]GHO80685.1 oxidoreductase [Ktedonobacter sp. SOSP1-85]
MLALRITEFGPPETLHMSEIERPRPGADEVLVEIRSAGLNPSDIGNILGRFIQTQLPRIPGRDFAGIVVEGPEELRGQEVWASGAEFGFTRDGSHAQYIVAPRDTLSLKPHNLSMEQAGAIGVPFLTAWLTLQASGASKGDSVLVLGARGAVGNAAIELGKMRGLRMFGAQRGEPRGNEPYEVINTERPDAQTDLMKLTHGEGVSACVDTVGGPLFDLGLTCLAHGGRLIAITARGDGQVQFNMRDFYHRELHLVGVDSLQLGACQTAHILSEIKQGFEAGTLRVPQEIRTFPLQEAPRAYQLLAQGSAGGKIVFIP